MAWTYLFLQPAKMTDLAKTQLTLLEYRHYIAKLGLKAAKDRTDYVDATAKKAVVDPLKEKVSALEAEMTACKVVYQGGNIDGTP